MHVTVHRIQFNGRISLFITFYNGHKTAFRLSMAFSLFFKSFFLLQAGFVAPLTTFEVCFSTQTTEN